MKSIKRWLDRLAKKYERQAQFIKYQIGGGLWFASHYAAFAIFYSAAGLYWLPAKILSDIVGWVVNYYAQRYWAFADPTLADHSKVRLHGRYLAVMSSHIILDYIIVGGLYYLGVTPYLGIFIAAVALSGWNWYWYKHWVFKPLKATAGRA